MTDQQKNARIALAVLFGINLMNFFDRQIAGALGGPISAEFKLSDQEWGWVNTAFTLMYAVIGIPIGRLTDNWKRTRLVSIGVAFWSVLTAASGFAWNYASMIGARIGVGIGEAACAPASQSLIGDLYAPQRRARAMAIFMLGLPLGIAVAYVFAGYIGTHWGWRPAFFLACIPGLLLAALTFTIREPLRGTTEAHVAADAAKSKITFMSIIRIKTLWWVVASGILFNFNVYAVNTFQTQFLSRFHELNLKDASNLSALSLGVAGVIGLLFGGWFGDRLRERSENGRLMLAATCMALSAPCVYIALQQPKGGVLVFTVLMAASTALTYTYYSTVYSAIQDVVVPRARGLAVSLYFFAQYVMGASFGTPIMGAVSDHYAHAAMVAAGATEMAPLFKAEGLHSAMYIMPVLTVVCAVVLYFAAVTVPADMRRMQARLRSNDSESVSKPTGVPAAAPLR
jgi:predicted MFS family arabinose efflux permease